MNKMLIALFILILIFTQISANELINKHSLEVGSWLEKDNMTKSDKFIKRHINETMVILSKNPNLDNASETDIWNYFLSSKTAKFISKYRQLQPTYY